MIRELMSKHNVESDEQEQVGADDSKHENLNMEEIMALKVQ